VRADAKATGAAATTTAPTGDKATASGGFIQGVIADQQSGEKLAGVTVVASSPTTSPPTAITDEDGAYRIAVPPGTYTLTFYYLEVTVERQGVSVARAKTTPVSQKLDTRGAGGEAIRITSSAPIIDQTTTHTGVTLDRNYQGNIPGRTFRATLQSVPGSTGGGDAPKQPPPIQLGDEKLKAIAARVVKDRRDVVVEVYGQPGQEAQVKM
jgi:hypothetical protein